MRKLLALLLLASVFCGKRGDPRPPVPVIPQATSDLVVAQRAGQVILSWSYPSLTTAGRSLPEIERIVVYRYVEELPVPAGGRDPNTMQPGNADPSVPQAVALFAKIPTIPQAQFAKLSSEVESIDKANLAAATAGAKLYYADNPPFRAQDGRPVRVTYALVTVGKSARSKISNMVSLVPLPVAAPPKDVVATPAAEGVKISWTAPSTSVTQDPPIIAGYNIYRAAPGEPVPDFAQPVNAGLITETAFTDVPPYGEHEYRITAVGNVGPPLLQSEMSLPVKATFRDLIAPPAPTNVIPLVELNAIRVVWDPVEATDLAGYRIYRNEGVGHGTDISDAGTILLVPNPIQETTWLNTPVSLGLAFRYAVTAIDKSGNESAKAWTGWIVAPKTP